MQKSHEARKEKFRKAFSDLLRTVDEFQRARAEFGACGTESRQHTQTDTEEVQCYERQIDEGGLPHE
jgi:hypothetical protein